MTFINCNREECIDLMVELLKVSIHQILWSRKLYPRESFEQVQKYNVLVHKSKHPDVNRYIDSVLSTVHSLLNESFLEKLVMVVKKDRPVEKYTFLSNLKLSSNNGDSRLNVMEIQQGARAIWLTLNHRFSSDERLDPNCTYTFEIHTKCAEYENTLKRQSTVEGLQWIEAGMEENPISIVPIRKLECQPFCIEVFKEDFANDNSRS